MIVLYNEKSFAITENDTNELGIITIPSSFAYDAAMIIHTSLFAVIEHHSYTNDI